MAGHRCLQSNCLLAAGMVLHPVAVALGMDYLMFGLLAVLLGQWIDLDHIPLLHRC